MLDFKILLGDDYSENMSDDEAMELFNQRYVGKTQYETDLQKIKNTNDKLSSENADWKKKYREKMSAEEQLESQRQEAEEQRKQELEQLRRENKLTKLEKKYLGLGYSEEMASKAAEAQYDGDEDTLFKMQQTFLSERDKVQKAEWMKDMPTPPGGNDNEEDKKDPFLEGFGA